MKEIKIHAEPRDLYLTTGVDQNTIGALIKDIVRINDSDLQLENYFKNVQGIPYNPQPIKLYIDTYGGYCYQGLGLISLMETSKTPIDTYVVGCAMSMGLLISVSGRKRYAYKHSTFMYHQVSSMSYGTLEDMKDDVKETLRIQNVLEQIITKKTKITKDTLDKYNTSKKDYFFDSKSALKLNVIDGIL